MILAQQARPHWREHGLRLVAYAQNLTDVEHARWDAVVGAPLLQLYGMTETIGPPLMNPLHGRRRHDAIGRPVLGYRCRIVGQDGAPVHGPAPRASCTSPGSPASRSWRATSRIPRRRGDDAPAAGCAPATSSGGTPMGC